MAVHRKRTRTSRASGAAKGVYGRSYKKWMSSEPNITIQRTTTGALGAGSDLGAAARVIADRARELASAWSRQIPPAITVEVSGKVATISCDAPPAYPNEIEGVRHPTFGHDPWVTNQHRPFLGRAADEQAGAAMARYADKIDAMCRKAGFN